MAVKIEREFLVSGGFLLGVVSSTRIVQGHICSQPGRAVRICIRGEGELLTIGGTSDEKDLSRYEFGRKIPLMDAERLLEPYEPDTIGKVRYLVSRGSHTWEVDVFHRANEGLILVKIELSSEDEPFEKPAWLGKEVSGDRRYYDLILTKHPFDSLNTWRNSFYL